jgi:hypothetical protein
VVTVQRFGALGAVDTEHQQLRHLDLPTRRPTHPQNSTKTACRIKGREVSITARQDKQHRTPLTS